MNWAVRYAESKTPRVSSYTTPGSNQAEIIDGEYRDNLVKHDSDSVASHKTMLEIADRGRRVSGQMCDFKNGKARRPEYLNHFNTFKKRVKHHTDSIEELQQLDEERGAHPELYGWPEEKSTSTAPPIINWDN